MLLSCIFYVLIVHHVPLYLPVLVVWYILGMKLWPVTKSTKFFSLLLLNNFFWFLVLWSKVQCVSSYSHINITMYFALFAVQWRALFPLHKKVKNYYTSRGGMAWLSECYFFFCLMSNYPLCNYLHVCTESHWKKLISEFQIK